MSTVDSLKLSTIHEQTWIQDKRQALVMSLTHNYLIVKFSPYILLLIYITPTDENLNYTECLIVNSV